MAVLGATTSRARIRRSARGVSRANTRMERALHSAWHVRLAASRAMRMKPRAVNAGRASTAVRGRVSAQHARQARSRRAWGKGAARGVREHRASIRTARTALVARLAPPARLTAGRAAGGRARATVSTAHLDATQIRAATVTTVQAGTSSQQATSPAVLNAPTALPDLATRAVTLSKAIVWTAFRENL